MLLGIDHMQFTSGDYVAMASVAIAAIAFAMREMRGVFSKSLEQAVYDTNTTTTINSMLTKLGELVKKVDDMVTVQQAHEVKCAAIQAKTAAAQERTAEILADHGRSIGNLQSQIRNATMSNKKPIEYPAEKRS